MKLSGNTILITGGGSGIGRGLAEALHRRKNHVIIAGRRKDRLMEVATANPGMAWVELNIEDPASISTVAAKLTSEYPKLNVLINNAGIMNIDDVSSAVDDKLLVSTLTTNLMGPIRMTSALIEHLKRQTEATVINTTSVLGFVPLAVTAIYSSTKAAMHSYTMSLRYKLKGTRVTVLELAPAWVQTDLLGSNNEPRAMPLADFIEETMRVLGTDADEVLVERAKQLRNSAGPHETAVVTQFNDGVLSKNKEVNVETNKQVVLKVLEGAFIERDATIVDRYFSPDYVQHNPVIPNGPGAIANLIPTLKDLSYEIGMVVAEGDRVMVHGRYVGWGPKPLVAVDIFRVKNGGVVEHWDVMQEEVPASATASGNPMFTPA